MSDYIYLDKRSFSDIIREKLDEIESLKKTIEYIRKEYNQLENDYLISQKKYRDLVKDIKEVLDNE